MISSKGIHVQNNTTSPGSYFTSSVNDGIAVTEEVEETDEEVGETLIATPCGSKITHFVGKEHPKHKLLNRSSSDDSTVHQLLKQRLLDILSNRSSEGNLPLFEKIDESFSDTQFSPTHKRKQYVHRSLSTPSVVTRFGTTMPDISISSTRFGTTRFGTTMTDISTSSIGLPGRSPKKADPFSVTLSNKHTKDSSADSLDILTNSEVQHSSTEVRVFSQKSKSLQPVAIDNATPTSSNEKYCKTKVQTALHAKVSKVNADEEYYNSDNNTDIFGFDLSNLDTSNGNLLTDKDGDLDEPVSISSNKTFDIKIQSDVNQAMNESITERSVLPILKKELQFKIQVGRLKRGKSELVLTPEEPKTFQLTPDEIKKRNVRLEQNRRSARKARTRRRDTELRIKTEINSSVRTHTRLENEISKLLEERDRLKHIIDEHMKSCTRSETPCLKSKS